MTVYVDDLRSWGGKKWCHLVGTEESELDYFATSCLGLKRKWRQNTGGHLHYDLTPANRELALRMGARYLPTEELLKRVRKRPDR